MSAELNNTLLYIRNLDNCPPSYLYDPGRRDFFEILWLQDEEALHDTIEQQYNTKGHWIYLIPPYRVHQLNKAGKKGILLSFKREFLDDDVKEFLLDIFRVFNIQGEFSYIKLDDGMRGELEKLYPLLEEEYLRNNNSPLILKTLLKAFLLRLIQMKQNTFTTQDLYEKRIYEFMVLLENHYRQERNTDFYAEKMGISSKRLNQILKERLTKTGTQLIHHRLTLEAKRQIIHSESTIKEIAYDLGFNDRSYFSRFFKQQSGMTPEQFQKDVKKHINSHSNTLFTK